jgi:hypothetical protein
VIASSFATRAGLLVALAGIAATQTGCIEIGIAIALSDLDDDEELPPPDDEWTPPPPPPQPVPPEVTIQIADWPPIGPSSTLEVNATAANGVSSATISFRNEVQLWAEGETSVTFSPSGAELGEGLGRMAVRVTAIDGAWTERAVDDLLVDLSPPVAVLGPTTLPASGASFDFWMGDAWVVSSARFEFAGAIVEEVLPEGYPDTLGVSWDYSLVRVPVEQLPATTDVATITVRDAAGNEAVEQFTLSIDGEPPEASFAAPAEGATVSGVFQVVVDAFDAQPGPVVVELQAGGAPLATATGPEAVLFLDAAELAAGPLALTAVAYDEAGNASAPAHLEVVVDHAGEELPPEL